MSATRLATAVFVVAALVAPASARADAQLDALASHDFAFAASQLSRSLGEVPAGSYPHRTTPSGAWATTGPSNWTSGFFPGSAWLMYEATGDTSWRNAAEAREAAIEPQKNNLSTHDLGFMVFDSFGNGYRLTADDHARQVVLTAAQSLATRYSPVVQMTRSWNNGPGAPASDFQVIVDNMMNLELLFWAAKNGGDGSLQVEALNHALRSANEHVRPDGSTYHLVVFDGDTGSVKRKEAGGGYSATSTWSRGQAWAVHGFTMAYRETGDSRLLTTARKVADYFIDHLPSDGVPPWDFNAPGSSEPRDSSAASIGASALLALSTLDPDQARAQRYRDAAEHILTSLSLPPYLAEGTSSRSILLHGTSDRKGGSFDTGLIYGDYFFLEALLRYRALRGASSPPQEAPGVAVPPPAPGESGGPLGTPSRQARPVKISVISTSKRRGLRRTLRQGLRISVHVSGGGTLQGHLALLRSAGGAWVAHGAGIARHPSIVQIRLRFAATARQRLRSVQRLPLRLMVHFKAASGGHDTVSSVVVLHRLVVHR